LHRLYQLRLVRVVRRVWRHCRIQADLLYRMPATSRSSSLPVEAAPIRWLTPPPAIPTGVQTALFAHPDSAVKWKIRLPARGRIAAWVGLDPETWRRNSGGVRFAIRIETVDGRLLNERVRDVHPGTRRGHRRWLRLTVPGRTDSPLDVVATFRTSVPQGGSTAYAWAIWGDPQVEQVRSASEAFRIFRAETRQHGLVAALKRAGVVVRPAEHSEFYRQWLAAHTPDREALARLRAAVAALPHPMRFSVVMPVYNTDPQWLRAAIESVRCQAYPHWELCIADDASPSEETVRCLAEYAGDPRIRMMRRAQNGHIAATSNDALALATGDFVALLDHDDELSPDALAEMAFAITAHPDADILYSDEDKIAVDGERCDPFFKPDWSPEHFLGQMYTCHLTVMRRSLVNQLGGFRSGFDGTQDYDLWLRMISKTSRILHVPKVLYHWRKIPGSAAGTVDAKNYALDNTKRALQEHADRNHMDAEVVPGLALSLFRVRRRISGSPQVTICIPTAGRSANLGGRSVDLLAHAVGHIAGRTTWPHYRILIADNGDLKSETIAALEKFPHHRITYPLPQGPFNFSRKINFLVGHCETEYLVVFNDDIEMITPDWIEGLLEYAQDPAIGAVGCKLHFPDGRLQHVGVVTGVCGVAAHIFHQAPADCLGWNGGAITPRNYSVVTGALMMTKKSIWDRVGGFDPAMRIDFNDVDFCLKLREAGYRLVYTPFVEAYHHESASFGVRQQNPDDIHNMQARWGDTLLRDPYYNPNLSVDHIDCRPRT
jgi:GT2 family glycosyltransferase